MDELTDAQWARIRPRLPKSKKRGRPRVDDRKTINGILWVLRSGARWKDMPGKYGSPVTCWRRLIRWQREGVWDQVWRGMLRNLDDQKRLDWARAYLDASFAAAKKGAPESV